MVIIFSKCCAFSSIRQTTDVHHNCFSETDGYTTTYDVDAVVDMLNEMQRRQGHVQKPNWRIYQIFLIIKILQNLNFIFLTCVNKWYLSLSNEKARWSTIAIAKGYVTNVTKLGMCIINKCSQ
jgi:hypothetical protein